jgi:hypothetical protein
MLSRIHQKLGTAGFIISIVALVAALGGGAYAASGGLSGKQKKEVEKIAKQYAGKPGANGATGPAGPTGTPGAKGDAGAAGANGTAGTNGTNGTNGTSVTNTSLPKGSTACPEGGAEFKVGTGAATHACNGVTGFTETLPTGKTETGTWNVTVLDVTESGIAPFPLGSISFPIPLASGGKAFVFTEEETEEEEFGASGCAGTVEVPTAPAGTLCVYTAGERRSHLTKTELQAKPPEGGALQEYGVSGATLTGLQFGGTPGEPASAAYGGSWAVTAP